MTALYLALTAASWCWLGWWLRGHTSRQELSHVAYRAFELGERAGRIAVEQEALTALQQQAEWEQYAAGKAALN